MSNDILHINTLRTYRPVDAVRERYLILYGGGGSGKSYYAAQRLIERCIDEPGERFLVIRKVARTIRASTFQLFLDILPARSPLHVRRTEMSIVFPNGSEIVHAGLDDAEKLKSIAGVSGVWIEEATEITEDDFRQVNLRLRGETPSYKQIILTFNPISDQHWIKKRFFDEAQPDTFIKKTTYRDNPRAGQEYTAVLEGLTDERFRQVYTLGEWGAAIKGLIYPTWISETFLGEPDCYGLDFGFNNPTALVALRLDDDEDLSVREDLYERKLTNSDLIARLESLIDDKDTPIYCDSAEPQRIEELIRAGYNAHASDKSVLDGIDHVRRYALKVDPASVNIQNELRSYKYAETRGGETLDKPVKYLDHALDALRYAAHSHYQYESWFSQ